MPVTVTWKWERCQDNLPLLSGGIPTGLAQYYRYLWLKTVNRFRDSAHCANCFVGNYSKRFGLRMAMDEVISEDYNKGQLLYFCGVSRKYDWNNNLHLAGRVVEGAQASVEAYNGDRLVVEGLEAIEIDASYAQEQYPTKGRSYLTCRNFQFGVQAKSEEWL